jgi:thioesterase domain-containing protein/acyl carrier protein
LGEIEEALAAIWQDLLHIEGVGRNDDFFESGGHSLIAVQLMAKINTHFKQMLPLAILFTAPNIAGLARLISSAEESPFALLVPIQTEGNSLPIFAVPGAGGNVLSLRPLRRTLGADQPLYGLQAIGLDGKTPPLTTVAQTAAANIAALKTLQPRGPYSLIGHSYGGVVAYEMARILLEQGEEVTSLMLLDSRAPSAMQGKSAGDETIELAEACVAAASQSGASIELDVEMLRQLSNDERAQYIVGLLNDRGLEINNEQFGAFYGVYRANQHCYRTYIPQRMPRPLDVSLYRAMHPPQDEATSLDYGWNPLLQSPIHVIDVEADHFSILERTRFPDVAGTFDH